MLHMRDNTHNKKSNKSMDIGSIIHLGQRKWYQQAKYIIKTQFTVIDNEQPRPRGRGCEAS